MHKLTPEEQNALVARAQAGDKSAQAALLNFCERDILAIVGKMLASEAEREDLAQVARLAVLESAIPNFNPTKGLQFRFYAALWARTEARRFRNINSSAVVVNARTLSRDISLDAPVSDDTEETLGDLTESGEPNPEEAYTYLQNSEQVRVAMERIITYLHVDANSLYDKKALYRDLVYERLLSDSPVGLDVIAKRFRVARETVRKHENYVLRRLTAALEAA